MRLASPWSPRLSDEPGLTHERLVHALEEDLADGRVPVGARMPAHRDLAYRLGIGLGTVTKAYALLEKRGLVRGVRGRGMFVAGTEPNPSEIIDLSVNTPPQMLGDGVLSTTLAALARQMDADSFGRYRPPAGSIEHREAMAHWLAQHRFRIAADRLLLTNGAQHALAVALAAAAGIGGAVFTEALTYPGAILAARQNLQALKAVALDAEGLRPDALDAVFSAHSGDRRVVYLTPTLHNPTGATMGLARRQEIVAVCRAHDASIIEDDVYSLFTPAGLPALAELAPERTFYIAGFSKILSPGLRIGALAVPPFAMQAAQDYLQATSSMASPLMCAIMERWIRDGTARAVGEAICREAAERAAMALAVLESRILPASGAGFHLWLPMSLADAASLAQGAAARGVMVTPPAAVMVDENDRAAGVRLCMGAPSREDLMRALRIIRLLLDGGAEDRLARL
ncbi:PLP-dependent aminotransferase family protein [Bosea sp. LjRoot90]|uniref:aminotransferase-like domain-containing protein n=1 Tax=Bosea sp. LjRoot90 TaxID=3342342 RepID=UPI003ED0B178